MKYYEFDYSVEVDPEEVMDSLSVAQIKSYLMVRDKEELKDKARDFELTREEEMEILSYIVKNRCPVNMESDRKSICETFDSLKEEYLDY